MKLYRKLLSGWMLACLLLAGQFTLLLHETDHTALSSVSAPCVFCLSHSTFEGAAPAAVITIATDMAGSPVVVPEPQARPEPLLTTSSKPRAPPVLS